ncbi:MAG TPA: bifunctional phosphopantothenoylcysteine decarboxylase/phosphopantothenate--cysteine ligase CoaBC [Cytophagaceae bacterium]|jgi:phosphopantothenoylcysteine decarboxylase/phosphopantothenate--cysteine ligase|nr:bifunctional phosphopantothenoylcysteine decarboxylase/phosphopantothenate--cysteine ligase CoaBC [Cytophagaceae bacterium]
MLRNKKILVGVCGSIAAYKSAFLIRLLIKAEAEVKVVMTASASAFISPLTLSTLSKNPVFSEFVKNEQGEWNNHVELGLWADAIIIAPTSANTVGKLANGICDNLLCAVYLSSNCPVFLAPAMDLDMYKHPSTQLNLSKIKSFGNHIIEAETGELASGLEGKGRMAEPENIITALQQYFSIDKQLSGKKILITAGPTQEAIDPVRYISNHSTGKMGYQLAEAAVEMGAEVTLVSGPSSLPPPFGVTFIRTTSAQEMYEAVEKTFHAADIIILSAAVADYTPVVVSNKKIKKKEEQFSIELTKTVDIAKETGKLKSSHQITVGFALETDHELENAQGKLISKNLDLIVLNSLNDQGAGFGHDTNKITILDKNNKISHFELKSKKDVATDILETIYLYSTI